MEEKPFWTVQQMADALGRLGLTHPHSTLQSVRILHEKKLLIFTVIPAGQEPQEILWGEQGIVEDRAQNAG
jgi:hypothetical protein